MKMILEPHEKVKAILTAYFDVCKAGGMPKERQEAIYQDIMNHFPSPATGGFVVEFLMTIDAILHEKWLPKADDGQHRHGT